MTDNRNLNSLERISFKLTDWFGTPISLVAHTALYIGAFLALRYFEVATEFILLSLATTAAFEAMYFTIFIQAKVNRNTKNLAEAEKEIQNICEEEKEAHKLMVQILHLTHQMKNIRKTPSGNGNGYTRIHA